MTTGSEPTGGEEGGTTTGWRKDLATYRAGGSGATSDAIDPDRTTTVADESGPDAGAAPDPETRTGETAEAYGGAAPTARRTGWLPAALAVIFARLARRML